MEFAKTYLDNRELSWLKFNQRVLEESEDNTVPLFERLRFVSIFCSNLDEFFMIRVGSLHDQTLLKVEKKDNKTNLTPTEQLALIADKVDELIPRKDKAYYSIINELSLKGIAEHVRMHLMSKEDEDFLREYFTNEVLPLLTPSIIDKRHPVQFLKNKEIYIGTILRNKNAAKDSVYIGVLPGTAEGIFKRVVYLPSNDGTIRFALVENVILHFVDMVFTNYTIEDKNIFRITRNADIDVDEALFDQDLDFREVMEELLKKRKKLAPVRIEFGSYTDKSNREKILSKLNIDLKDNFLFVQNSPLDMSFVFELEDKLKNTVDLFAEVFVPQPSKYLKPNEPIINQIEKGDILLSYPYNSFKPFIQLLTEASHDPEVVSIKITLYRVARNSKIVEALVTAAENGKDVLALVELRARFDEENNIGWSKTLEDAGVQVIYGLDDLKVHSKLLLITKRIGTSIRYYTQVGTGNYNERTSKLYTDFTLLTSAQDIGTDASIVFNTLSVGTVVTSTNALWVAPKGLKSKVIEMIDTEITYKNEGYIGLKLNSLTDKDIIEKLVEASKKGVRVELLIRGICCLVSGIPKETENIRVVSVVGRFLEHSRIYIFGSEDRQKIYISSADFMTRNTERRVEVAAPIRDEEMKRFIIDYFKRLIFGNVKARIQNNDGSYSKVVNLENTVDTQVEFYRDAYKAVEKLIIKDEKRKKCLIKKLFKKKKEV